MEEKLKELTLKAKKGDTQAFGELYQIFLGRIYRFIFYLIYDEAQAEDLTQNTFLKAWKNLANFSFEKGTFQAYLYAIARNSVIDSQRKKKEFSLESGAGEILSDENPEREYQVEEETLELKRALGFLSKSDRQLVLFRFFEDLSYAEIAEILGEKEGTARVKVHRALKVLKEKLNKNGN